MFEATRKMIKQRQYKVVRAECSLCRKTLEGISEKHWINNFKTHLHLAQNHMLSLEEIGQIIKTIKPSFHSIIKTKFYME